MNKDTQTPGGTIRFSLKPEAIKRYYITAEYQSAFLGLLRKMLHSNKSALHHPELQEPHIQKDEESVSAVVSLIQGWVNPFSEKQDLVSISTAKAEPRGSPYDRTSLASLLQKLNQETLSLLCSSSRSNLL